MSDRDKFSGDMSRNEVEIDLSKFMEMVTENNDLKQKIWELEHDSKVNPWQKYIFLAKKQLMLGEYIKSIFKCLHILNLFRSNVVPRFRTPTMEQSGLISILVGGGCLVRTVC